MTFTYHHRVDVVKGSPCICIMDHLEQPLAYQHANAIICRLEGPDTWKSFLSPDLEPLDKLKYTALMIKTTNAHEVFVGAH